MSRHKLVKRLDLDEELNDFDGGNDDYEGVAEQTGTRCNRANVEYV